MTSISFQMRPRLAGTVLALAPGVAAAQQASVRLVVQAERSVVELGEPVYLAARLTNTGSQPVRLFAR